MNCPLFKVNNLLFWSYMYLFFLHLRVTSSTITENLRKFYGKPSLRLQCVYQPLPLRRPIYIKHIRAKPSALSQNPSQLLARMRRCVRVILSTRAQLTSYSRPSPAPKALGVVASSKSYLACTSREATRFLALG